MNGVALLEVNKPLRHSCIQMTERYAHLKPEAVREAVNALDRLQPHSGHGRSEANANRAIVTRVKG